MKAASGSYSQTSKQTHGCSLQGVGRKPRALSRHEMVLHVTARAEQPGHLEAESSSVLFPLSWSARQTAGIFTGV